MPTPRGKSGVGGRWGISVQTLSPTLSESKNLRLSPAAARRLQVSQSPRRPISPNPASAARRFAHGLLRPGSCGWRPERHRGESSLASPAPEAAAAGARLCEGGGHGTGGGGGQRGEGEEPRRQTAARTNPAQAGRSRAEAGPSALQPLRVGGVG